jgi:hypothetical protein
VLLRVPRFYFHLRDGDDLIEDQEGILLPDMDAVREEAFASAREILAERLKAGELLDGQRFEIVDDCGVLQATIPLRDVLKLA